MMSKIVKTLVALSITIAVFVGQAPAAVACPFCSAPSLPLSEQMAQADAIALVQWVSAEKNTQQPGNTTYEILRVVKVPAAGKNAKTLPKKGDRVTLVRFRKAKKGDLFLLTGSKAGSFAANPLATFKTEKKEPAATGTADAGQTGVANDAPPKETGKPKTEAPSDNKNITIEWASPLAVTEISFNYITQSPSPEVATQKRLQYFLKFLEFPDRLISDDAFGEFANAPLKDIVPLADKMPRTKIRQWVKNPETMVTRLGLYGLLLGLCGNEEDAKMMKAKINDNTEDFRLGIDGVMFGYLLLAGESGLEVIEKSKFQNKDVTFSETYAAMQALRQLWRNGNGKIEKKRLQASMRLLLDRPELADLVIADLARWRDWSVQDRLVNLYGAEEYNIPSIKRAIVRFLLVCSKDVTQGDAPKPTEYALTAKTRLAELRKKDPKTVREAERFFFN